MPELKALLEAVNQNNDVLAGLTNELADLRVEVETLPNRYIPRDEANKKARVIRKWFVGLMIGGVLTSMTVGSVLYLNHGVTCGVRGILVSAQTSSMRNPLPADLTPEARAEAERRREMANEFYKESLDKLNIIWPCAGETTP